MNIKRQRAILILLIIASLIITIIFGIADATQIDDLKRLVEGQAEMLKDRRAEIDTLEYLLAHQKIEMEAVDTFYEMFETKETKEVSLGEYTITAYCPCYTCCGEYALNRPNGIVYGASGIELIEGVSVASPLPFGTKIIIDGHEYINQDRTSKRIEEIYDNKIIDLYFEKHQDAENFGKQVKEIFIVEDEK